MKRLALALGAFLLVGGWGTVEWAKAQQRAIDVPRTWVDGHSLTPAVTPADSSLAAEIDADLVARSLAKNSPPTRIVFAAGVIIMAMGAGLIALRLPRPVRTATASSRPE